MRFQMTALLFAAALSVSTLSGASTPIHIPEKPQASEPPRGAIMDGGATFFTVQFDVETGTFLYLGVNGGSQGRFSE